ncbi:hypothetical protein LSAT2_018073 [Lamellibrachia satsuma]|nr:hypothetical protein LSAT2_018073 [Lamellibrachia satsuma]
MLKTVKQKATDSLMKAVLSKKDKTEKCSRAKEQIAYCGNNSLDTDNSDEEKYIPKRPPQSDLLTEAETEKGNSRKASFGADISYIDRAAKFYY